MNLSRAVELQIAQFKTGKIQKLDIKLINGHTTEKLLIDHIQFRGAKFINALFSEVVFDNMQFGTCQFRNCTFADCTFQNTTFGMNTIFEGVDFINCLYSNIICQHSQINHITAQHCTYANHSVTHSVLNHCNYLGCTFHDNDMTDINYTHHFRNNHATNLTIIGPKANYAGLFEGCEFIGATVLPPHVDFDKTALQSNGDYRHEELTKLLEMGRNILRDSLFITNSVSHISIQKQASNVG